MIQFNLLPDVKVEFIKTRRRKRLIVFISVVASAATFTVFLLLLLFVRVNQPKHLSDLDKDIKENVTKIQEVPDIDKILTIQNQLNSLPGLHDKKVINSRVVDYLNRLTPAQATVSDLTMDFETSTMTIKGNADNLVTVNKFVDTLKFTDYKVNNEAGASGRAFKGVVLQTFSVSAVGQSGSKAVTYELNLGFEPAIFALYRDAQDPANQVTLNVPSIISTRSATESPASLFSPQPQPTQPQNQGGRR